MVVFSRILLVSFLLALAACGFRPLYGSGPGGDHHASVQGMLGTIAIADIQDHVGVMLKNQLIDRFYQGPAPVSPAYTLTMTKIAESMSDLDITIDEEATRRQLRLATTYTLTPAQGGAAYTRSVYAVVSFNVLESRFTTRVAENNARENAVVDLARQIEQGVVLYLQHTSLSTNHAVTPAQAGVHALTFNGSLLSQGLQNCFCHPHPPMLRPPGFAGHPPPFRGRENLLSADLFLMTEKNGRGLL